MMSIVKDIPCAKSGNWKVEEFEVPENSIENIRAMMKPGCRAVKPGKYKRLTRNGCVIMSNTPAEMADFNRFIWKATGNVLINGLGLGCVIESVLKIKPITNVTVIEISQDVINLVAPYFTDPRVKIVHADAFKWEPPRGVRYNAVWHDIWDDICGGNLPEMTKLHRKYGRRTDWQDSWAKGLCKRYAA
ncbi:MAG: hypothetical protein GY853_05760 [PVC group bacterium]|nr:hypothetical protein [PVC group bacterium]